LLHVGMNCYAFYNFGRIFEMLANRAHLAIVFLLSAVGGGVLSLVFAPSVISVGASGSIVGIIGYLLIYAFRRRQFTSPGFRKSLLINIGFIIVFGLALYNVIDNFGHIGGLLTGAVYGLIQIPSDPHVDPRDAGSAVDAAGVAGLGLYIAACVFSILLILKVV
jgi:rhomboid protease GluP